MAGLLKQMAEIVTYPFRVVAEDAYELFWEGLDDE